MRRLFGCWQGICHFQVIAGLQSVQPKDAQHVWHTNLQYLLLSEVQPT
jgi:hypothetical protein